MAAAENDALVRRIFEAFARKQGLALRGLFAEDAVWTVPGRSIMAGTHRGREQIFRFLDVLASDERAAALYRARGRRGGRKLALDQVLLFHIADGLVQEVLALPSDPDAFEAFWAP